MTTAYFDCFSGVAGDMILGGYINLGMNNTFFKEEIKKLKLKGYTIKIKKIEKNGYVASDVTIIVEEEQPLRTLTDIHKLIEDSGLKTQVKTLSKKIFYTLAKAESTVHHCAIEDVHFHEVGAVDSIIDIVGSAIGIDYFRIDEVYCSSLPLGSGFVICQHGRLSVPTPATIELLKGIPTYELDSGHEMVTPTGAAILTTICSNFNEKPELVHKKIGYGAGKIKSSQPGVLKIVLGEKTK
ncbi:MAG: LarC family nickel insertion protein [Candidatus Thermoplasmatota archaeon]|nr:LarC family nickel insertion protein [Candidatus Thermoplasmatota archaeon]